MRKGDIFNIALSSLLASLAGVLVIVGGFFEMLDLSVAALSSLVVLVACEETKKGYPILVYTVSSAIALIFMPFRSATLYYVLFLGYYPIVKLRLDAMRKRAGRLAVRAIKFACFNTALFAIILLTKLFIGVDELYTPLLLTATIALANVFFVCYDYFLAVMTVLYRKKLSNKLHRK